MALETVRVTAVVPASADRIYAAWLDGGEHARMTGGGAAAVDPRVGGEHSAWDGYIRGTILELEPSRRIVQSWRSTDFPLGAADSRLEVHLLEVPGGTEVTIIHSEVPEGQGAQYESGWRTHYFEPMTKYFRKPATKPAAGAAKKVAKKPAKKAAKMPVVKAAKKPAAKAAKKPAAKAAKKRAAASKSAKKVAAKAKTRSKGKRGKK